MSTENLTTDEIGALQKYRAQRDKVALDAQAVDAALEHEEALAAEARRLPLSEINAEQKAALVKVTLRQVAEHIRASGG